MGMLTVESHWYFNTLRSLYMCEPEKFEKLSVHFEL